MTPIAPLITSFLREHMPIERGSSPHTCETYAHAFRLLFLFASKRLGIRPQYCSLNNISAVFCFLEDRRCRAPLQNFLQAAGSQITSALECSRRLFHRARFRRF